MKESRVNEGFTLIEMVVVIAVIVIVGVLIVTIFSRSLRGGNKTLALGVIKQNGQSVLENMDKVVRNADNIVCVNTSTNTFVIFKEGIYTRYRIIAEIPSSNGHFVQDTPTVVPNPDAILLANLCSDSMPQVIILTDTNGQTGVSVIQAKDALGNNLPYFDRKQLAGFKDALTIQFALKPGVLAPDFVSGQIDLITFQTTISLR